MTSGAFDDLGGEFKGKLREIASTTRQAADGASTVTFSTARIDCDYSPSVIKKLATGQLVAIPNVQTLGTEDVFSVYEIADVFPMHYSQLTLDRSQPAAIRKEFMELIESEWKAGSKSTWIEMIAAPIGYVMRTSADGSVSFERKPYAPLTGSSVKLLSRESVEKLICYRVPRDGRPDDYRFGSLMGVIDDSIPFTVNVENLIHYMVGIFAFTGSGKSNLTATVVRKAMKVVPDLKVVILDLSSEYGIHILDVLNEYPSKVLFTDSFAGSKDKAGEYFKRHVCPEALSGLRPELEKKIARLFDDQKVVFAELPLEGSEEVERFSTYGGLIEVLTNTLNDKYGAVQQKIYVPQVIAQIKQFMHDEGFTPDTRFNAKTPKLIGQIQSLISDLPANSSLKKTFDGLAKVVETLTPEEELEKSPWETLPDEILSTEESSPRVFVINLPEAEDARAQTADVISKVFRKRKKSFSLTPKVLFIIDEAQEFIPQDARKGDNAYESSKAVERLLRQGRKYNLFCWVSTQRIAHLNTNALQQLHSYFISTMPRPYDRQLVADSFAIDDAFVDRTLAFQNGDWLLTSFKATATQNIPVFFHAENNEDVLRRYLTGA
ncbi:MAG: ATP-binding protein [Nitrososphaerota archaeon]|nr:ATP-binding protein [Nitrososphaerota archaeon]